MSFKLAIIDAEQDKSKLTDLLNRGKITPMEGLGLDHDTIQKSEENRWNDGCGSLCLCTTP